MQFIGLKDENGKEIYEGDVIEELRDIMSKGLKLFTQVEHRGLVAFKKDRFIITKLYHNSIKQNGLIQKWVRCSYDIYFSDITYKYEVIGNVYENPELLKEDNNG